MTIAAAVIGNPASHSLSPAIHNAWIAAAGLDAHYGWIEAEPVWDAIRGRAERTNVFCTGRNAPPELVDLADTVTEMRKVKHAYESGVRARRGIDF